MLGHDTALNIEICLDGADNHQECLSNRKKKYALFVHSDISPLLAQYNKRCCGESALCMLPSLLPDSPE